MMNNSAVVRIRHHNWWHPLNPRLKEYLTNNGYDVKDITLGYSIFHKCDVYAIAFATNEDALHFKLSYDETVFWDEVAHE